MMKRLILFLLILNSVGLFAQNQIHVKKATVMDWIIYQGDTLTIIEALPGVNVDTLVVRKGYYIDSLIFSANLWSSTGNDIANNNSGKVILPKDSTYFSGIPDEATKVGRVLHVNQYGKTEWVSPLKLYEEQLDTVSEMPTPSEYATWKRDTTNGYILQADITDKVGIGTNSPTESLDIRGGIRLGQRKTGCSIVFTDDDGQIESYTETLPLFDNYDIPCCLAINPQRHSDTPGEYMSWAQMDTLQNIYGWEIINHSWNHENLNTIYDNYGADSVRTAVRMGKDSLTARGYVVNNFCYPFGSESPLVRKIIRENHISALGRDYNYASYYFEDYNRYPLETYRMPRFDFDCIDWDAGSYYGEYEVDSSKSYFYYKEIIDTAYKYGYHVSFMMHSRFAANDSIAAYDKDSTLANFWTIADQILSYIVDSLEIPVYTQQQFLETSGNLIDIGDPDPDSNYFAVSATGEMSRMKIKSGATVVGSFAGYYGDQTINMTLYGERAGDSVFMATASDSLIRSLTAIGYEAGYKNTRGGFTSIGYQAGKNNTGNFHTSVGYYAGVNNIGLNFTGTGYQAGYHNTADGVTVMGTLAGVNNTGASLTAFGYNAAASNTKATACAFGSYALNGNTGTGPLSAFGHWSGRGNTGNYLQAFGYYAGRNNTGANVTAFGYQAAYANTGNNAIMIGYFSGYTNTTANRFVLGNTVANATPLLIGDLAGNKLGIGVTPDSALTVTGGGRFTQGLKAGRSIDVTGNAVISGYIKSGTGTIANNDASPSVAGYNTFIYNGTANSVSIDALDDHVVGCYYTIIGNSNTYTITVIDGTPAGGDSFNLSGSSWVGGSQDLLMLYCIAADAFVEVSRSDN